MMILDYNELLNVNGTSMSLIDNMNPIKVHNLDIKHQAVNTFISDITAR